MRKPKQGILISMAVLAVLAVLLLPSQKADAQGLVGYSAQSSVSAAGGVTAGGGIGGALNNTLSNVSSSLSGASGAQGAPRASLASEAAFGGAASSSSAAGESSSGDSGVTAQASSSAPPPADLESQIYDVTSGMGYSDMSLMESLGMGKPTTPPKTFEEWLARKKKKHERLGMMNGTYGTDAFIPRRQEALERVIQQAKDMQFSQRMIDEIAELFRLQRYDDNEYHVLTGKNTGSVPVEIQRYLRRQRELQNRWADKQGKMDGIFAGGPGGGSVREPGRFAGEGGGVSRRDSSIGPSGLDDEVRRGFDKIMQGIPGATEAGDLPPDVISSIEAAVHNAVLDKLRAKGYNVAALNVFLQNIREVKIVIIVTTSELPRSAIRSTLRQIRSIIENEVLKVQFPSLGLAQLSSFTLLNEVDNHFYEHPVLYWEMQMDNWTLQTNEVTPGVPGAGVRTPKAQPGPEADEMLNTFLGVAPGGISDN